MSGVVNTGSVTTQENRGIKQEIIEKASSALRKNKEKTIVLIGPYPHKLEIAARLTSLNNHDYRFRICETEQDCGQYPRAIYVIRMLYPEIGQRFSAQLGPISSWFPGVPTLFVLFNTYSNVDPTAGTIGFCKANPNNFVVNDKDKDCGVLIDVINYDLAHD